MHIYSKKRGTKYHGQYFLFYVAWYGFGRFVIEGLRGADTLIMSGTDIRVSQLLAALSFSVATVLLVRNHLRRHTSDPGVFIPDPEINNNGGIENGSL
jgi:phosphatidylglycerol:prolipoprotein diacylglycerol transferase